ncbi:MAG: hypothetical protein WA421_15385 [Nitrososphaeraceae archaeon]
MDIYFAYRPEYQRAGEPITRMKRQWGFCTFTIGIEIKFLSDGLVVLATPKTRDDVTRTCKTLKWINGEKGITYGLDEPMIILKLYSCTCK